MIHIWDKMDIGIYFLDFDVDTRSPIGRLLLRILSAVAEWEAQRIRDRTREAMKYRKDRGMPIGRRPPRLGWKYEGPKGKMKLVLDGHDREVIDRVVEWRIAGATLDSIAMHMQKKEIKTSKGRTWSIQRIKRCYYKEVQHLIKDGWLRFVGVAPHNIKIYEWVWGALPKSKIETLRKLYESLGRAGEVPECDVISVLEAGTRSGTDNGISAALSAGDLESSTAVRDCSASQATA